MISEQSLVSALFTRRRVAARDLANAFTLRMHSVYIRSNRSDTVT